LAKLTENSKYSSLFFLAFFALVWWGVPSAWRMAVRSEFIEFQAPFWELSSRMEDLSHYWGHLSDSKKTLIEKGKQIQRIGHNQSLQILRLESMQSEMQRLLSLKARISTLEKGLKINPANSFHPIVARVSLRTLPSWWQGLTIRKGKTSGIADGMGVIYKGGVAGRIIETGKRSSQVELITNPSFRIVAHFSGDDRPVTFQGNGISQGGSPFGVVLDVPQDIVTLPNRPLLLITSSLNETFPQGIPIGTVSSLEGSPDGLFKTGKVILDPDLSIIRESTILIPIKNND